MLGCQLLFTQRRNLHSTNRFAMPQIRLAVHPQGMGYCPAILREENKRHSLYRMPCLGVRLGSCWQGKMFSRQIKRIFRIDYLPYGNKETHRFPCRLQSHQLERPNLSNRK